MRNPKRIKEILELLELYWDENPDLRLGQILSIASKDTDVFYIEDDKIIEWIRENINK